MATKALHTWGFLGSAVLASAALLSACGGGSSSPAASTLSGTAAVGVPIVAGAVTVNCAAGSTLTTTTTSTGSWTVTINGQTLPCATRVSGGTVGGVPNATPYHSIAVSFGTVNITPLTDLVVAQLTGTDPATWFTSPAFTGVDSAAVTSALTAVKTNLGLTSTLGEANPLTATFAAKNGDKLDDVLEALKNTLADASVNKSYAQLLAAAAAKDFSTFSGFQTAFSTIYVNLAPATPSGATSCATGETLMVFSANTSITSSYSNGQGVCFSGSSSALSFSGKTLTNPVQNTVVTSPYSAYKFTDTSNSYEYEVIFSSGTLYEINVMIPPQFAGQFAPSTASAGAGASAGTGTLTVATTVMGLTTTVVVSGVTKPADQSEFCSSMQSDSSITALKALGTFALTGCTYSGNTATITALVTAAGISIPYSIAYTYS